MDAALPPPVQFVESDVPCTRCGYSLRGLLVTNKCPECGWPVEASLHGGLLRYAGPEYLASLSNGAYIIVATNIASIVVSALMIVLVIVAMAMLGSGGLVPAPPAPGTAAPGPAPAMPVMAWIESGSPILATLIALASLAGYWQFTAPDPATSQSEQPRTARRVVRATSLLGIGIQLAVVVAAILGPRALPTAPATNPFAVVTAIQIVSGLLNLAAVVAGAVEFFAMMLYVRWLAQRIPDADMIQQTRQYIWLLPLLYTVGALCVGLGPIVALVLYSIMLWNLRRHALFARGQSLALAPT